MSLRIVPVPPRLQSYLTEILAIDVEATQSASAAYGPLESLCNRALDDAYLLQLIETADVVLKGAVDVAAKHLMTCAIAWLRMLRTAGAASDGATEATGRILSVLGAARLFWQLCGSETTTGTFALPQWLLWDADPRVRCAALMCHTSITFVGFDADLAPGCTTEAAQAAFERDTLRWVSEAASSELHAVSPILKSENAVVAGPDDAMRIWWLQFRIVALLQIEEFSHEAVVQALSHSVVAQEWSSTWSRQLATWIAASDARCGLASVLWVLVTKRVPEVFGTAVDATSVATVAWASIKRVLHATPRPTFRTDGDAMCARFDVVADLGSLRTAHKRSLTTLHLHWLAASDGVDEPIALLQREVEADALHQGIFNTLVKTVYRLAQALHARLVAAGSSPAADTDAPTRRMASMVNRLHSLLCEYGAHASVTPLTMLSYVPRLQGAETGMGGGKDLLWYLLALLEMRPAVLCGIVNVLAVCSKRLPVGVTHLLMETHAFPRICMALLLGSPATAASVTPATATSTAATFASCLRSFVLKAMCLHNDAKKELVAHMDGLAAVLLQPEEDLSTLVTLWRWLPKDAGEIKRSLLGALLKRCDGMTPAQAATVLMEVVHDPEVRGVAAVAKEALRRHLHAKMALDVTPDAQPIRSMLYGPQRKPSDATMLTYRAGMDQIPALLAALSTQSTQLRALPWVIEALDGCTQAVVADGCVEAASIVRCADAVLATLVALDHVYNEHDADGDMRGQRCAVYAQLLALRRREGGRKAGLLHHRPIATHDLFRHALLWTMREVLAKFTMPLDSTFEQFMEAVSLHIAEYEADATMLAPIFIEHVFKQVPPLLRSPYCWNMVQTGHRLLQAAVATWSATACDNDANEDPDDEEAPKAKQGGKAKKGGKKGTNPSGPPPLPGRPAHGVLCAQRQAEAGWMLSALLPFYRVSSIVAGGGEGCSKPFAAAASFIETLVTLTRHLGGDWLTLEDTFLEDPDGKGGVPPLLKVATTMVDGPLSDGYDWSMVLMSVLSACMAVNDVPLAYRCYRTALDGAGPQLLSPGGGFDARDVGRLLSALGVMQCHCSFLRHLHAIEDGSEDDEPPRKKGPGAKKKAAQMQQPTDADEAFVCQLLCAVSTALVQEQANAPSSDAQCVHVWSWANQVITSTIGALCRMSKRVPTVVAMLRLVGTRPATLCRNADGDVSSADLFQHPCIQNAIALRTTQSIIRRMASTPEATPNALCVHGAHLLPVPVWLDCLVDADAFFRELAQSVTHGAEGLDGAMFLAWASRVLCLVNVPVEPLPSEEVPVPRRPKAKKQSSSSSRRFVALRVSDATDASEGLLLDEARRALTHVMPLFVSKDASCALALLPPGTNWESGTEVRVADSVARVVYEEFLTCLLRHVMDLQRIRDDSTATCDGGQGNTATQRYTSWWTSLEALCESTEDTILGLAHVDQWYVGASMRASPLVERMIRHVVDDLHTVLLAVRAQPTLLNVSSSDTVIGLLCRLLRMWSSGPLVYRTAPDGYLGSNGCQAYDASSDGDNTSDSVDRAFDFDDDDPDATNADSYEGSDEGDDDTMDDCDTVDSNTVGVVDRAGDGASTVGSDEVQSESDPFAAVYAALPSMACVRRELCCAGRSAGQASDGRYAYMLPTTSLDELDRRAFAVSSMSLDDYVVSLLHLMCEGHSEESYTNICTIASATPRLLAAVSSCILRFCDSHVKLRPDVRCTVYRVLSSLLADATATCHSDVTSTGSCAWFAMDTACALRIFAEATARMPDQLVPDEELQLRCMLESFVATKDDAPSNSRRGGSHSASVASLVVPPALHPHGPLSYENTGDSPVLCNVCSLRSSTVCHYACRTCNTFSCCVVCGTLFQAGAAYTVMGTKDLASASPAERWCQLLTVAAGHLTPLDVHGAKYFDEAGGSVNLSEQLLTNALRWMQQEACTERSCSKLMDLVRGILKYEARQQMPAGPHVMVTRLWSAVQQPTQSLLVAWRDAVAASCKGAPSNGAAAFMALRTSSFAHLRGSANAVVGSRLHRLVPIVASAVNEDAAATTRIRQEIQQLVADMVETVKDSLTLLSPVAACVRPGDAPCGDHRPLASASELSLILSAATALEAIGTWQSARCDDEGCVASPGREASTVPELLRRTTTEAMIAETNETSKLFLAVLRTTSPHSDVDSSAASASAVAAGISDDATAREQTRRSSQVAACLREHAPYLRYLLKTVRRPHAVLDAGLSAYVDPTCVPYDVREKHFRGTMQARPLATSKRLTVSRSKLLESSLDGLKNLRDVLKQHPGKRVAVTIHFLKERAVDAGGVIREWISCVTQELCKPHGAQGPLLRAVAGSGCVEINPRHCSGAAFPKIGCHTDPLLVYEYVGVFLGLCLSEGHCVDLHFPRALYKHLTGRHPSLFDLEATDPQLYNNLLLMNKMQSPEEFDGLCQNFTVSGGPDGSEEIPLIPGGADVAVSNANKKQYIRLVADYTMTTRVAEPWTAVMRGMALSLPITSLKLFTAEEIELLSCGLSVLDVEDWRAHTKLEGYTASSPQVMWFWDLVTVMRPEERSRLLQFVHGSSNLPMGGFSALNPRFTIAKASHPERLPTAHTCTTQLELPTYPNAAVQRQKLLQAVDLGCVGFGFA